APFFEIEARRDEVATCERDGLIELGEELGVLADLHIGQPLSSQAVQLGHDEAQREVVAAVAFEIVFEIEADADVIGTPTLATQIELESRAAFLGDDRVVDRLEQVERI